jgi:hypothetical protein
MRAISSFSCCVRTGASLPLEELGAEDPPARDASVDTDLSMLGVGG